MAANVTMTEIHSSWNGQIGWRRMFEATSIPAAVFLVGLFFIPESPRWLVRKGYLDKAMGVLERIGGQDYAATVLGDIKSSVLSHLPLKKEALPRKSMTTRVLVIGVSLAGLKEWCG